MIKNLFILSAILVLGYSYLTNTGVKTMFNHAQQQAVEHGVKVQNPITFKDI